MECCWNELSALTNRLTPPDNIGRYLRENNLLVDNETPSCKECGASLTSIGREPNLGNGSNYYTITNDEDDEICRICNRIFCFCPKMVKRVAKYDADIETDMGASSANDLQDIISVSSSPSSSPPSPSVVPIYIDDDDDEEDGICWTCRRIFCFCPETIRRFAEYDAAIEDDMEVVTIDLQCHEVISISSSPSSPSSPFNVPTRTSSSSSTALELMMVSPSPYYSSTMTPLSPMMIKTFPSEDIEKMYISSAPPNSILLDPTFLSYMLEPFPSDMMAVESMKSGPGKVTHPTIIIYLQDKLVIHFSLSSLLVENRRGKDCRNELFQNKRILQQNNNNGIYIPKNPFHV